MLPCALEDVGFNFGQKAENPTPGAHRRHKVPGHVLRSEQQRAVFTIRDKSRIHAGPVKGGAQPQGQP